MRKIKHIVWVLIFGVSFCINANAQYSALKIDSKSAIEIPGNMVEPVFHKDLMDTLISKLSFDVEIFIKVDDSTDGASRQRNSSGDGFLSTLRSGGGMAIDTNRFRDTGKPISLIIKVPSDDQGEDEPTVLRGIKTRFNDHFRPTTMTTKVLEDNEGLEIIFYFEKGVIRMPDGHDEDNHITDFEEVLRHVVGHICDPGDMQC